MHEALGGLDQLVEAADPDHPFARRDRVERLDRAGECAGMRHRRGAAAFGGAELERDHGLARRARRLAGIAERLGVAHAFEVDDDHLDARILGEVAHQIRRLEPGLVARGHHVADADTPVFQRLADRHDDRAGLAGDRHRALFHGDDAIVDIGEELFAGAQIAEAVRARDREPRLAHRSLQFGSELLAFVILQLAEAGGDDGGRPRAGCGGVADHLHGKARRHQHQDVIGLLRKTRKILVAGNAPDGIALGVDRIEPAFETIFDQIVPDALGIIAGLVGRAHQHDVVRVQHCVDALDDVAGIGRRRPWT
ncbi:hypothetical protein ABH992_004058 [Bradyrhizobium yuanmingense]|uniref:Uncharacterized protein n=1 Tax=Bradyrhizobium yuanmingense TaxID=108015 RepID=A0ABV4GI98_9BRAD